jgi:hypothetical protein
VPAPNASYQLAQFPAEIFRACARVRREAGSDARVVGVGGRAGITRKERPCSTAARCRVPRIQPEASRHLLLIEDAAVQVVHDHVGQPLIVHEQALADRVGVLLGTRAAAAGSHGGQPWEIAVARLPIELSSVNTFSPETRIGDRPVTYESRIMRLADEVASLPDRRLDTMSRYEFRAPPAPPFE